MTLLVFITLLFSFQPLPANAQESCQVSETRLRDAINSYSQSCSLPRVDCDPINGQWVCASFEMVNGQPVIEATPVVEATPVITTTPAVVAAPEQCEYSATTLNAARIGYQNSCSLPRVDCDPINGRWTCASYQLGSGSPGQSVSTTNSNTASSNAESVTSSTPDTTSNSTSTSTSTANTNTGIVYGGDFGPPQRAWLDSYSANGTCYISSGFDHGIGDVQVNTPAGTRTVREVAAAIGAGPGIGDNPIYNDVQCGNGPANNAGDEDINQCPGRVDSGTPGCSMRGPLWDLSVFSPSPEPVVVTPEPTPEPVTTTSASPIPGPSNAKSALPGDSRYVAGDLISMHYDNGGDRDDGHATVAGKMVVSYYGLRNALHIVNGAYDESAPQNYNPDSEIVMNVTWGSEGQNSTWWNADAQPANVRNQTAARWRETLEAGQKVWIAEGGPSDFTADVLRQIETSSNLNLKDVHIVQHSHGWNEEHTNPANVTYIERVATYHRIGNGNLGGNDTPDLNQANDAVARRFLADPEFGVEWQAAFNYLPVFNCDRSSPHCKFDGSDAVELMWIVGVQSDEISGWSDFAARYAN